jgi:putative transposase
MNPLQDPANAAPGAAEIPADQGSGPARETQAAVAWDQRPLGGNGRPVLASAREGDGRHRIPLPPQGRGAPAAFPNWTRARNRPVETAIIERYRRGEGTVEETMLEIHQAGISMQRAEAVARLLWGAQVDAGTVSDFTRKIGTRIATWRNRPIRGRHFYVFLGAIDLQRRWGGAKQEVRVLAAVGVNLNGFREVLGVADGTDLSTGVWRQFLRDLQARGLTGVQLFVSHADPEIADAAARTFPAAGHQICVWQLQRDLLASVGIAQVPATTSLLDELFESENSAMARRRAQAVAARLREMDAPQVAHQLEQSLDGALSYLAFPREHWRNLRSNFVLMTVLRKIRERTRLVGAFSDSESAVLMVSARLRFIADQWSATRRPWDMSGLTAQRGDAKEDSPPAKRTRAAGRRIGPAPR